MPTAPGLLRRLTAAAVRPRLPSPAPVAGRYWVAAALALGVAVRVRHYAANHSYWYDEAYLLLNVFRRPFADLLGRVDLNLVIPPGFLWLERAVYLLLGPAEWALRLPAFVVGLLALAAMVPLGRRAVGGRFAWFPVALLAVAHNAVGHGCEVRPYTFDVLIAALTLLFTARVVADGGSRGGRRAAAAGLLALAAAGPWLSFPSAFVLGGAGAAVLVRAMTGGGRRVWLLAAVFAAVCAASGGLMWHAHARHLYYPGLNDHWGPNGWGGFPDFAKPGAVVLWPLKVGVAVGHYGTREMGPVLLALAAVGLRRMWRSNPAVAAAVAVPAVLAVVASYLGKYPLADRTVVFLLPGLWVAAAAGVAELAGRFPARRWPLAVPVVVLAFELVTCGQHLVVGPPAYPAAREAFAAVRERRQPDEVIWGSHVEVYYLYHAPDRRVCGITTPPGEVVRLAAGRRVWLVDQRSQFGSVADPVVAALRAAGYVEVERRPMPGIDVFVYERPGQ